MLAFFQNETRDMAPAGPTGEGEILQRSTLWKMRDSKGDIASVQIYERGFADVAIIGATGTWRFVYNAAQTGRAFNFRRGAFALHAAKAAFQVHFTHFQPVMGSA